MNIKHHPTSPTIMFLPHGGGPMPLLDDPDHRDLTQFLQQWPQSIATPTEIVVISAHWEAAVPTVTGGISPSLIYDYGGFPAQAYQLEYPAPGSPPLATRLHEALQNNGFAAATDKARGFDHGVFVPLTLMYPQARIPCVQVSLLNTLDAAEHWAMGEAISQALTENTLLIGSGLSFHNLSAFRATDPVITTYAQQFDDWLVGTCTDHELTATGRQQRLCQWSQAPAAQICHPRAEHLIPCHVCAGAARGRPARAVYRQPLYGKAVSALQW